MLSYYGRWFRTAFTHSMGLFDLWTGLVTAALGVVDHYWPAAQIMTTYAWQIPVWALAAGRGGPVTFGSLLDVVGTERPNIGFRSEGKRWHSKTTDGTSGYKMLFLGL